jgi:hypothetical protein
MEPAMEAMTIEAALALTLLCTSAVGALLALGIALALYARQPPEETPDAAIEVATEAKSAIRITYADGSVVEAASLGPAQYTVNNRSATLRTLPPERRLP